MKVKCINQWNQPYLRLNSVYDVTEINCEHYEIIDDSGKKNHYRSDRFVEVVTSTVDDIEKFSAKTDELIELYQGMVAKRDKRIKDQTEIIKQLLELVDHSADFGIENRNIGTIKYNILDILDDWV
jgi:hypothetical protein